MKTNNILDSISSSTEEIENETKLKNLFKETFSTPDGREVLGHILNMCGYFSNDPSFISPDKISVANNILRTMGVNTEENMYDYLRAITSY